MIPHMSWLGWITLLLIATKWIGKFWLQRLNQRHVRDHAEAVPEAFKGTVDEATYAKSVEYTLAKGRLSQIEAIGDTLLLIAVLFSGALAWAALLAFQLVMLVLAPVLILPLFNKFTPLPEGSLRERLLKLASRTEFRARSIQIMDGSKRSRHSNAFFTGFGGFRKIVLFDTLVEQLGEPELEAVLAHEIGHFKRKHIPKMLLASAVGSLVGFYLVAALAKQEWFYRGFGFEPGNLAVALLLFGLLSSLVTFWFSPIA